MRIDTVSPRGGAAGTSVVVLGDGFGIVQGRAVFNPLGSPLTATVTAWLDERVEFSVPAGVPEDAFSVLYVEKAGAADGASVAFWVPGALGSPDGLGYQYPVDVDAEGINTDDPNTMQAADFNRLMSRVGALVGGGDMLKAVYDGNDDGAVGLADALDDAGVPRTFTDILALIHGRTFSYLGSEPSPAEMAAALNVNESAYFKKGPNDPVFHVFRRSADAGGGRADFTWAEMR